MYNKIECWYVDLVGEFQKALRQIVAQKGIAIECNPTSNVLISTFRFYDRHPILTFNHYHLEEDEENVNIQVSINTDDLGVFNIRMCKQAFWEVQWTGKTISFTGRIRKKASICSPLKGSSIGKEKHMGI